MLQAVHWSSTSDCESEPYEFGAGSYLLLATRFAIGYRTLQDWVVMHRKTGSLEAKPERRIRLIWRSGFTASRSRPMNCGNKLTMIGALRADGWITMSTMFKSAIKERFIRWVRRRLLPKLRRGDVVILDNAPPHKDYRLVGLTASRGATVRYLPPTSPDFNPIEPGWAVVKKGIRACAPRTRATVRRVLQNSRRRGAHYTARVGRAKPTIDANSTDVSGVVP